MQKKLPDKKISVLISDEMPVFRFGLSSQVKEIPFVHEVIEFNYTQNDLNEGIKNYDVMLIGLSIDSSKELKIIKKIKLLYPALKIVAFSYEIDSVFIEELLKCGVCSCLIRTATFQEIKEALAEVSIGNFHFPIKISQDIFNRMSTESGIEDKHTHDHFNKLKEIIFLIYREFESKEIAKILNLSTKTIDKYRMEILHFIGCFNIAGIVRYAIERKIYLDADLSEKFAAYL